MTLVSNVSFFNKTPKVYISNVHLISTKGQMSEIRVKMLLTEEQEERLEELKKFFKIDNNAKLFKRLLEVEIRK